MALFVCGPYWSKPHLYSRIPKGLVCGIEPAAHHSPLLRRDLQEVLRCSVLLEKLHKLTQGGLQRALLVRHEEASARVQRRLTEWRRVELHKIFCEELEEATRMGELEKGTAKSLQHDYFACQVMEMVPCHLLRATKNTTTA